MTVTPAETVAVVVGIEDYAAGASWRLDGPALDAGRFARWLRLRGVPAENITLLVSPLPENSDELTRLAPGFPTRCADYGSVRHALTEALYRTASDLLIIYWGGHGIVDSVDACRLFYADATHTDKRNLNVTSLLRALRSDVYSGHPRQLVLIDACLNLVDSRGWVAALPDERFAIGGLELHRNQQALFAASPGELAINDNAQKSGLFSQVIREGLDGLQDGVWPPDGAVLQNFVTERFNQLRDSGRTGQTPSRIWYKSPNNDSELVYAANSDAGPVTAQALNCRILNSAQFVELRSILDGAPAPADVRALYREVTHNVVGLPARYPDDLMSAVGALRGIVGARPLFEFLVRLAAGSDSVTRHRLWDWIRVTAPDCELDLNALTELDATLCRTFLLVRLEPDAIDLGYHVTIWAFLRSDCRQVAASDDPWDWSRLAAELGRLLDGYELQRTVAPIVEFLVPSELLDHDLETLPVLVAGASRELGEVCPVVVRPADRLTSPASTGAWQHQWQRLAVCTSYDPQAIYWVDGQIDLALMAERICVAFAAERATEDATLTAALSCGVPVILWHRANGTNRNRKEALERVLRGRALRDLPDVVLGQRIAARHPQASSDHAGRDIVLLWDDPNRLPSELDWHAPC